MLEWKYLIPNNIHRIWMVSVRHQPNALGSTLFHTFIFKRVLFILQFKWHKRKDSCTSGSLQNDLLEFVRLGTRDGVGTFWENIPQLNQVSVTIPPLVFSVSNSSNCTQQFTNTQEICNLQPFWTLIADTYYLVLPFPENPCRNFCFEYLSHLTLGWRQIFCDFKNIALCRRKCPWNAATVSFIQLSGQLLERVLCNAVKSKIKY